MNESKTLVVFEHGILSGGFAWSWVLPRLPGNVEPIVIDRNGSSSFDLALRRLDYRALLRRLSARAPQLKDADRVVLVGHSIGGLLIRAHANALGSRVRGLVYVDPSSTDQFDPAADVDFQFLRLQQFLLLRTARSVFTKRLKESDIASIRELPQGVRMQAARLMTGHRFWLNAYREARAVGSQWLDSALFPSLESRPTAVVSSAVSTDPESIQNRFEEQLLASATPSHRVIVRESTHESVLYNEAHSQAVNDAIVWVLNRSEEP